MPSLVIAELTDYETNDTTAAAGVQGWMFVLLTVAGAAGVDPAVIGGVTWSQRRDAMSPAMDASARGSVAPRAR